MRKKVIFFTLPAIALFCIGAYILQINSITALAYHTAETETTIRTLKEKTTSLEVKARQGMTLGELETLAQRLHFQKVQSISYLKLPQTTVAQNSQ